MAHAEVSGSWHQIPAALNGKQWHQLQLPNHHDDQKQPSHATGLRLPRWFLHGLSNTPSKMRDRDQCAFAVHTQEHLNHLQGCSSISGTRAGRREPQCSWSRFGVWCMNSLIVMMYPYHHDVYERRTQMEDGEIQLQVQIRLTTDSKHQETQSQSKSTVYIQRAWSWSSVLPKLQTVAEENCGKK